MRLGSFGWGEHDPKEPGRAIKDRPCIVVFQNPVSKGWYVLFGRSRPFHGVGQQPRVESVKHTSPLGRQWKLTGETFFHSDVVALPHNYREEGALETADARAGAPGVIADYSTWLKLRGLAGPPPRHFSDKDKKLRAGAHDGLGDVGADRVTGSLAPRSGGNLPPLPGPS